MQVINLPQALLTDLMIESDSFRRYVANLLNNGADELRDSVLKAILDNKGNKISAIREVRELSVNRCGAFKDAYPARSFTFSGGNCLGLADAKYLVENLAPIGHFH